MTIIVDTKPAGYEVARWFSIRTWPTGIDIVLNYTDQRTGCYMRRWIGNINTIGM